MQQKQIVVFLLLILSLSIVFAACEDKITDPPPDDPPVVNDDIDLAYVKLEDNNWEVCCNNIYGTNFINVSNNEYEDNNPAWSPDGRYLAYTKFNPSSYEKTEVYKWDSIEDTLINLTPEGGDNCRSPIWINNGKQIIYNHHVIGEPHYTYIMNADGTEKRKLLEYQADIFVDPQSTKFIYTPNGTYDGKENDVHIADFHSGYDEILINLKDYGENYVRIADYNPKDNKILIMADPVKNFVNLLIEYNISTEKVDTIQFSDRKISKAAYSNNYDIIAIVDKMLDDSTLVNSKYLSIYVDKHKEELVVLTKQEEDFDFHEIKLSPNDRYIAYSKSVVIPINYMQISNYLCIVNIYTNEINLIDEGVNPQWNPKSNY